MSENKQPRASQWSYWLAVTVAALTFPLIWVGGLVTTYDAGMAVPDWPGTYGYNLFLYPWQSWISGPWDLFIEHGHRLLGALVGLVSLAFCAVAWTQDDRRSVRWLSLAVLLGVIGQGVLGGLRVLQADARIAQIHGCTGPLFFALAVITAGLSRPERLSLPAVVSTPSVKVSAWTVALLAVTQLFLGSVLRHVTFATSLGTFRAAVLLHVLAAVGLLLAAWSQRIRVSRLARQGGVPAAWLPTGIASLVTLQLLLGVGSWLLKYGVPQALLGDVDWVVTAGSMSQSLVITAHVAVGSLILASSLWWAVRVSGVLGPSLGFVGVAAPVWSGHDFPLEVMG